MLDENFFVINWTIKDLESYAFWDDIWELNKTKIGKFVMKVDGEDEEQVFYDYTDFEVEYDVSCPCCSLRDDIKSGTIKCFYGEFLDEWKEWYRMNKYIEGSWF